MLIVITDLRSTRLLHPDATQHSWRKTLLAVGGIAALAIVAFFVLQLPAVLSLHFPPGPDQDSYLGAAEVFRGSLRLDPKAPLYSAWLGLFNIASNHSALHTFYSEKIASLLLLYFGIGCLGYVLHSFASGAFLILWMANLKYVAEESNGSNGFAAIILVFGMIAVVRAPQRWKGPAGMLTLFVAALARPEFKAVLLAFIAWVASAWLYRAIRTRSFRADVQNVRPWLIACVIVVACGLGVRSRLWAAPFPTNVAVHDGFAVTYFQRKGLQAEYVSPWIATQQIWLRAFPGLSDYRGRPTSQLLVEMWQQNSREVVGHLAFNTPRTAVTTAAVGLGFRSRLLMLGVLALYITYLVRSQRRAQQRASFRVPIELWYVAAATLVILPVAVIILPQWRYFIPLMPGIMVTALAFLCTLSARVRVPNHANS